MIIKDHYSSGCCKTFRGPFLLLNNDSTRRLLYRVLVKNGNKIATMFGLKSQTAELIYSCYERQRSSKLVAAAVGKFVF